LIHGLFLLGHGTSFPVPFITVGTSFSTEIQIDDQAPSQSIAAGLTNVQEAEEDKAMDEIADKFEFTTAVKFSQTLNSYFDALICSAWIFTNVR